jgi:hypothetical protein
MEVVVSESASDYVTAHGGVAYVRARSHHCCSGSLTLLDVSTKPPKDIQGFDATECDGLEVQFYGGYSGRPQELLIELRGRVRQHLVAFWDGCAFKI